MNLEFGNAWNKSTLSSEGVKTGWFVGSFDEIRAGGYNGLRASDDVEVKWYEHPKGQESGVRPISKGLSLSILVDGLFGIWFCEPEPGDDAKPTGDWKQFILKDRGDYLIWGPGLFHKWQAIEPSIILSVRPTPG